MCRPKEEGGRRCASHSPSARRAGRAAVRLYGSDNPGTRAIVESLPPEYVNGTISERAQIAATTTDDRVIKLAARDPKKPVVDALAENPKREKNGLSAVAALPVFPDAPIAGDDYHLEVDDVLLKRKESMDEIFAENKPVRYDHWAANTGIASEELERLADQRATEMAAYPVAIQVPKDRLCSILDHGVLNQFQTGDSNAVYKPWKRIDVEWLMLDVDPATPPADRPRYGLLKLPGYTRDFHFGQVELVLRDDVKTRATFCAGDSLNETYTARPCTFDAPHGDAITSMYLEALPPHLHDYTNFYCEVQIRGEVTVADIACVRGPKGIRKMVEARGLRWELGQS